MVDPDGRWPWPVGPSTTLLNLSLKVYNYLSGSSSSSSSRGSSIGGGSGSSGQGGIMLSNSKGGSSGQTDLIRNGGRQGSDVLWGDASGFVQAGSFATSMRDGIKYNGSTKMVAKIVKETVKGVKIGDKVGGKMEGANDTNPNSAQVQIDETVTVPLETYSATGTEGWNTSTLFKKERDTTVAPSEKPVIDGMNRKSRLRAEEAVKSKNVELKKKIDYYKN